MKVSNTTEQDERAAATTPGGADLLTPLVLGRTTMSAPQPSVPGVTVGELIGIIEEGCTPLVSYAGQVESAVVRARSVVDLYGSHIGKQVVLMFEDADPTKPIIMGVLGPRRLPNDRLQQAEVEADGERLIVTAREQLVLRCGKACITLTRAGKVLIQGTYLLSKSSGANGIKGASVNIN